MFRDAVSGKLRLRVVLVLRERVVLDQNLLYLLQNPQLENDMAHIKILDDLVERTSNYPVVLVPQEF